MRHLIINCGDREPHNLNKGGPFSACTGSAGLVLSTSLTLEDAMKGSFTWYLRLEGLRSVAYIIERKLHCMHYFHSLHNLNHLFSSRVSFFTDLQRFYPKIWLFNSKIFDNCVSRLLKPPFDFGDTGNVASYAGLELIWLAFNSRSFSLSRLTLNSTNNYCLFVISVDLVVKERITFSRKLGMFKKGSENLASMATPQRGKSKQNVSFIGYGWCKSGSLFFVKKCCYKLLGVNFGLKV